MHPVQIVDAALPDGRTWYDIGARGTTPNYSSGGAILIMSVDGKIEFSKAGTDGKEISL